MSVGINASQARAQALQDMIIYNEATTLMSNIITASANGVYYVTVSDGTTMTESSPSTTVTGTVANPVITSGQTLILNNSTITLGTSGTGLNAIIADINDAGVTGISASKDSSNHLQITFTAQPSTTWTYDIGTGTANVQVGVTTNQYTHANPSSVQYFSAWQGTITDRAKIVQMDAVIKHFQNLGYKIERTTNTQTSTTFQWNIYW